MTRIKQTGLTLSSSVYESIREDIMEGRLQPGEKLLFDDMRAHYDVGISPIREALSRLQADGWVDREEQRGYRVGTVSPQELVELVRTRVLLEGLAVREAIGRQDVAAEETLVLTFHRLGKEQRLDAAGERNPAWEQRHREFHLALVAGCRLPWITQLCARLFDAAERYRLLAATSDHARSELAEHRAILDAYVDGDADRVTSLLAQHYQVTVDHLMRCHFADAAATDLQ